MEEMALEHIHPSKAPYGYIRNKETGHLEIEPIEAEVVKEIFELCKNPNCKSKGIHYSSDKIKKKLGRILNELTRYMYDNTNEIIVCNSTKTYDIKDIDRAIEKLKLQEKKLVDLYLSSSLNVETINRKNNVIKREIKKLKKN